MIKLDENSNAQAWELEVVCRNKKYLDAVVKAILKYGCIGFEVEAGEGGYKKDIWDGRYTVLIWCSWFSYLGKLGVDLSDIEEKLEKI